MNERKEYKKYLVVNFLLLYILPVAAMCLYLKFRSESSFEGMNKFYAFIYPLILSSTNTLVSIFRLKYITLVIENIEEYQIKLDRIIVNKKIKYLYSTGDKKIYKIKTKYIFIPILFSIEESEKNIEFRVPKIFGEELSKWLYGKKLLES